LARTVQLFMYTVLQEYDQNEYRAYNVFKFALYVNESVQRGELSNTFHGWHQTCVEAVTDTTDTNTDQSCCQGLETQGQGLIGPRGSSRTRTFLEDNNTGTDTSHCHPWALADALCETAKNSTLRDACIIVMTTTNGAGLNQQWLALNSVCALLYIVNKLTTRKHPTVSDQCNYTGTHSVQQQSLQCSRRTINLKRILTTLSHTLDPLKHGPNPAQRPEMWSTAVSTATVLALTAATRSG